MRNAPEYFTQDQVAETIVNMIVKLTAFAEAKDMLEEEATQEEAHRDVTENARQQRDAAQAPAPPSMTQEEPLPETGGE